MQATVYFVDSQKMIEFYVNKDINSLAVGLFVKGFYSKSQSLEIKELAGEEAAEEVFDLTNNPYRQDEREQVYGRGRSLSVGDIVEVEGDMFICAPNGWQAVDIARV